MRLKKSWSIFALGELAEKIEYGLTASAKYSGQGPKFLRITDIQNRSVNWPSVPVCNCAPEKEAKYRLRSGDIVFARTGATTGKSYLITDCPPNSLFASYLIRVRPSERIYPSYLACFFQTASYWEQVTQSSSGSAQPGVNATKLKNLRIPLPPLPEQKRIVEILDEAFAAIDKATANTEKNIKNAEELLPCMLSVSFACPYTSNSGMVALEDYLLYRTYGFTNPMPTTQEGPLKITAKNVNHGRIMYESARHTSIDAFDSLLTKKSKPDIGDVLVTKDGTLGRVAVVDQAGLCINQSVALLRPTKDLDAYFLMYLLSSPQYQKRMIQDAGGTTIKHIYITRLPKILVSIPSICEQIKLVEELDEFSAAVRRLKEKLEKKHKCLSHLKQSILHKAFTGELTSDFKAVDKALSEAGV